MSLLLHLFSCFFVLSPLRSLTLLALRMESLWTSRDVLQLGVHGRGGGMRRRGLAGVAWHPWPWR